MPYKLYNEIVRQIKKDLPPDLPVVVRRVKLFDNEGECIKKNGKYYIKINNSLSQTKAIDVLLHEWAHTLAWPHGIKNIKKFNEVVHGPKWGKAYSKVYQWFEKNYLGDK